MTKAKILIVEDESLVAMDLQQRLEASDYKVTGIADNFDAVLESVSEDCPDLALMDIRIKGEVDGIQTANALREEFDVPSIYVTAHSDVEMLERAKRTFPLGYIVKPFANVDFRAQIEVGLWRHAIERERQVRDKATSVLLRSREEGIIIVSETGRVLTLNDAAAELTGWNKEEAKGQLFLDVFAVYEHPSGHPFLNPINSLRHGQTIQAEHRTLLLENHKTKQIRMIEVSLTADCDESGSIRLAVIFEDASARNRVVHVMRLYDRLHALATFGAGLGSRLNELVSARQTKTGPEIGMSEIKAWADEGVALGAAFKSVTNPFASISSAANLRRVLARSVKRLTKSLSPQPSVRLEIPKLLPAIAADAQSLEDQFFSAFQQLIAERPRCRLLELKADCSRDWSQISLQVRYLYETDQGFQKPTETDEPSLSFLPSLYAFMALIGGNIAVEEDAEVVLIELMFPSVPQDINLVDKYLYAYTAASEEDGEAVATREEAGTVPRIRAW